MTKTLPALSIALIACTSDVTVAREPSVLPSSEPSLSVVASRACPDGLVCTALAGVSLCAESSRRPLLCDRDADCPDVAPTCQALQGQGVCTRLCEPSPLPAEHSLSGIVTEHGTAIALVGARVCIDESCTLSDAAGFFTLSGLRATRGNGAIVSGVLSFRMPGYLDQAQPFQVGLGAQMLDVPVALFDLASAQRLASAAGTSLPDATHGWLLLSAQQFDDSGIEPLPGVRVLAPADSGLRAYYPDEAGQVQLPRSETSRRGEALFLNIPTSREAPTQLGFEYRHASLDCRLAPVTAQTLPGMLVVAPPVSCGHGVN